MICVSRAEKIYVSYGQDPIPMVKELLSAINLQGMIPAGARIGLKPNLVVARPAREGATTDPEVVEGVIQYLRDCGFRDLAVLEGSWVGDSAEGFSGVQLCRSGRKVRCGADRPAERLFPHPPGGGLELHVCDELSHIDFLINFPVLRPLPDKNHLCPEKPQGMHSQPGKTQVPYLRAPQAHRLSEQGSQDSLVVVDGLLGDLDFEEGGNPVQMDRIIVGTDPVQIDSYVASLLGYEPAEIPYITLAEKLGVGKVFSGSDEVEVVGARHTTSRIKPARQVEELARIVREDQACSACYGSLIHALGRLRERGLFSRLPEPILIGQGFKGKRRQGIGIGSCTRGFASHVQGCPRQLGRF